MKQDRQVAYLSDGEERSRQNAGGLLPGWAREMRESERAVGEARAILAETEPETLDTRHASATGLVSWQSHAILAESLAAFVALEIS